MEISPQMISSKQSLQKRYVYADLLRVIAAFMVVLIHTTCNVYDQFSANWNAYLYVNSLTSFAVPCFILISGSFLLHKEEGIADFLRNRLPRILIPLVFWSVVYVLYRVFYLKESIYLVHSLIAIIIEPQYSHLWFMYTLTAIYLITPLLQTMYKNSDRIHKIYMLTLFLVFPVCVITIETLLGKWSPNSRIFWYFPELGYFLLGAMITSRPSSFYKKMRKWLIPLTVFAYICVVFFSYYISIRAGSPKKDFINYDKLFVLIFAVSVFSLLYSYEDNLQKLSKYVKKSIRTVSSVSLGIYLVHPLVMNIVGNITIFGIGFTNNASSIWNMVLGAILYFTLSFALCYCLSKIPVIKRVVA